MVIPLSPESKAGAACGTSSEPVRKIYNHRFYKEFNRKSCEMGACVPDTIDGILSDFDDDIANTA